MVVREGGRVVVLGLLLKNVTCVSVILCPLLSVTIRYRRWGAGGGCGGQYNVILFLHNTKWSGLLLK